jgi:hypothetical protein
MMPQFEPRGTRVPNEPSVTLVAQTSYMDEAIDKWCKARGKEFLSLCISDAGALTDLALLIDPEQWGYETIHASWTFLIDDLSEKGLSHLRDMWLLRTAFNKEVVMMTLSVITIRRMFDMIWSLPEIENMWCRVYDYVRDCELFKEWEAVSCSTGRKMQKRKPCESSSNKADCSDQPKMQQDGTSSQTKTPDCIPAVTQ